MGEIVVRIRGREAQDVSEKSVVGVDLRRKRAVWPGPSPEWGDPPQSTTFEKVGSRRGSTPASFDDSISEWNSAATGVPRTVLT